ncbi:integral membrane sensor signal transduction histidine kinase [Coriobacterium glomerans PW2]|uniref:histidine kinase n=1 Tax=Coriobacterium glomerans (strain ATCC 49209 / DSM 20642 / JCM 10262 / PW2) TaxID=700015 RepID=F2NAA5_CORGP|nr:histidine kinase [Coriobacterium glomerans]AEB06291.1 integral membrane sensor signal transduction histidine kinase [Coriobacterium glomerans PW2]
MERLLDKTIVLICCGGVLALTAIDAGAVATLCCAIIIAALVEVLREPARIAPGGASPLKKMAAALSDVLPVAWCALALFAPPAVSLTPLALYDLARSRSRVLCVIVAAPLAVALARESEAAGTRDAGSHPLSLVLTICLCAIALLCSLRTSQTIAQRRRNRRERDDLAARAFALEERNRDLIDRQSLEAQVATLSERARIAREIHDSAGHLLTRAVLQVEALRVAHEGEPRVQADFTDVEATLASTLETVRASVHALREDSIDLAGQMRRIAEDITHGTAVGVRADISVDRVPAAVASCLLAIAREAISNALRHSDADLIRVRCLEHPAFFQLIISNNGSGPSEAPAEGMGLASMRERVEALGGHLSAGAAAEALDDPGCTSGFRVFVTIPKPTTEEESRQ